MVVGNESPDLDTRGDVLNSVEPHVEGHQERARASVFIVEDHPIYLDGLRSMLAHQGQFLLVGHAGTGTEALSLVPHCLPDIILLDLGLPDGDGLNFVNQLRRACPQSRIVVLTGFMDEDHVKRAIQMGVEGYVEKGTPAARLFWTMQAVLNGERVVDPPALMTAALSEYGRLMRDQSGLTHIEVEILRLVAAGMSTREIGSKQFWSEITIKRKMQNIFRKLDVSTRPQAVAAAMRLGLI